MFPKMIEFRPVTSADLVSSLTPDDLLRGNGQPLVVTYHVGSIPIRWSVKHQVGVCTLAPIGQVWALGPGQYQYEPSVSPLWASKMLTILAIRLNRPSSRDDIAGMRKYLARILREWHGDLARRFPAHFPGWWLTNQPEVSEVR